MSEFLAAHQPDVIGVLEGFDRVLFRGTLSSISYPDGMGGFIGSLKVLYKDYGKFAADLSDRLKDHAEQLARRQHRPFEYVASPSASKEQIARRIAERDGIEQGLICVLSCVEPCRTISVRRNARSRKLELVSQERRCLHLYFYCLDRTFGFMHVRLQTWLPMPIQVCINGRHCLAEQLKRSGIDHEKKENCFTRIDDLPRAQKLLDELERKNWPRVLDEFAHKANPLLRDKRLKLRGYYWTIRESEYATDVMFKDAAALKAVYPSLVDYAMKRLDTRDVMRFPGPPDKLPVRRRSHQRHSGAARGNAHQAPRGRELDQDVRQARECAADRDHDQQSQAPARVAAGPAERPKDHGLGGDAQRRDGHPAADRLQPGGQRPLPAGAGVRQAAGSAGTPHARPGEPPRAERRPLVPGVAADRPAGCRPAAGSGQRRVPAERVQQPATA
jgi:hypothetical protein